MGSLREVVLPQKVEEAIQNVLDYLWKDEEANYEQAPPDEKQCQIFLSLSIIDQWLTTCHSSRHDRRNEDD